MLFSFTKGHSLAIGIPMARKYAPQLSDLPFHIRGRCQNKNAFPIGLDSVWKIFEEELFFCKVKFGFRIHSFVLMPNHFHLLASVQEVELGTILRELMGNTSKRINGEAGVINHLWGDRTGRSSVNTQTYYTTVYQYVYQNPVRAELVSQCEDWKYSSLNGLLGRSRIFIPIEDNLLFSPNFDESILSWLNCKIPQEKIELIKKGLRKKIFKVPKVYASSDPLLNYAASTRKVDCHLF